MQLLKLAVEAAIPIVAVETDDPMNVITVLDHVLKNVIPGGKTEPYPKQKTSQGTTYDHNAAKKGRVYVMRKVNVDNFDWEKHYAHMAKLGSVTIVVTKQHRPEFFHVGFLACPASLAAEFVCEQADIKDDDESFAPLFSALAGLSYQSMTQLAMLSVANVGAFTAPGLREVRREFFGEVRGLRQERAEVPFYAPDEHLVNWLALDGKLLGDDVPTPLVPRGLLFDGPPGTGKTAGAKYLARELDLPLYRLDIAATMNKYVGESEKGLEQALAQADRCAPCVMLIDEVEKLFGVHGDGGVTTRALSQLLWWLQEHQTKVLTVMTTNAKDKLPPELIRPGRIDKALYFGELSAAEGELFLKALAAKYADIATLSTKDLKEISAPLYKGNERASHAVLTDALMDALKVKHLSSIAKE